MSCWYLVNFSKGSNSRFGTPASFFASVQDQSILVKISMVQVATQTHAINFLNGLPIQDQGQIADQMPGPYLTVFLDHCINLKSMLSSLIAAGHTHNGASFNQTQ
jgi:hypothetical protein